MAGSPDAGSCLRAVWNPRDRSPAQASRACRLSAANVVLQSNSIWSERFPCACCLVWFHIMSAAPPRDSLEHKTCKYTSANAKVNAKAALAGMTLRAAYHVCASKVQEASRSVCNGFLSTLLASWHGKMQAGIRRVAVSRSIRGLACSLQCQVMCVGEHCKVCVTLIQCDGTSQAWHRQVVHVS